MKNKEMIQAAIKHLSNREQSEADDIVLDLLRRFLLSNEPSPTGKFDIYKYVSVDELRRKVLTGVYHENGSMIATDGTIVIILPNQGYEPEFEGKAINSKMEIIEGKYVNWRSVIKPQFESKNKWVINIDSIKDAVKVSRQAKKEDNWIKTYVHIRDSYFDPEYLLKLAVFAEYAGCKEFDFIDMQFGEITRQAAYVFGNNGATGLLCPVINITEDNKIIEL